jgi:regulator of RNase E activity RraA
MNKFRDLVKSHTMAASALSIGILSALLCGAALLRAQSSAGSATAQFDNKQFDNKQFDNNLIADFRRVEVASVSDALEQLTGQRMYMSHRMHPLFTTKFAGFARTVLLKKDEGNSDPAALSGMLTAIDQGSADSVYVMVVEDGEDIAGMGGLPVYSTGIVPSTSVHHYKFGGSQIPVTCDGVAVNAGDIVVADSDGVVVVPRAKAQETLALAQQMDFKEHSMYAVIEQLKSITEAVKKFGRL